MDALPDIANKNPDAYIILVGGDKVSYGNIPEGNKSYKEIFYNRVKDKIVNKDKIIFTGQIDYKILIALFWNNNCTYLFNISICFIVVDVRGDVNGGIDYWFKNGSSSRDYKTQ